MTDEFRIQKLLEQILESGLTPEEVCAESPELLPVVETRLRQIRQLEQSIDALFPSPTPVESKAQQSSDLGSLSQSSVRQDLLAEFISLCATRCESTRVRCRL